MVAGIDWTANTKVEIENEKRKLLHDARLEGHRERAKQLLIGIEALCEEREVIADQVALETGKSKSMSLGEFDTAVEFARMLCYSLYGRRGDVLTSQNHKKTVISSCQPVGIALLISSYNTPMPNLLWKFAPSFLAGNISILCPSPHVATSTLRVLSSLVRAGVDPSRTRVTNGNAELSAELTHWDCVDLISFTGSSAVGEKVSQAAAKRHPRMILELGGSNPTVVLDKELLPQAIKSAMKSAFSNGGQRCAAGQKLIVAGIERSVVQAEFEMAISDSSFVRSLAQENTPLITEDAKLRHEATVRKLESECGSSFVLKGDGQSSDMFIALDVSKNSETWDLETFSPILKVTFVASEEEAIAVVNSGSKRLTCAVWTDSLRKSLYFSKALDVGLVNFNSYTFGSEINFPFGGIESSGNGSKDAGWDAVANYSQVQVSTYSELDAKIVLS